MQLAAFLASGKRESEFQLSTLLFPHLFTGAGGFAVSSFPAQSAAPPVHNSSSGLANFSISALVIPFKLHRKLYNGFFLDKGEDCRLRRIKSYRLCGKDAALLQWGLRPVVAYGKF